MLEVKKPDASEIKYSVGRKRKSDGEVVIFWKEERATVVVSSKTEAEAGFIREGFTCDGWTSCMDEDTWEPVDIHIYG